ncbi:protein FAM13C-like [Scomber japonicus]|uniref:protein FAM13C-like n=1 Tax=Scomber japonicus TaxID=13676 RepID=UPI002306422C|nr:protein FAM13C-like [Scomber japonicus]
MFCFCLQSSLLKLQALEVEGGPSLGPSPEERPSALGSKEQKSPCSPTEGGGRKTLAVCHSDPGSSVVLLTLEEFRNVVLMVLAGSSDTSGGSSRLVLVVPSVDVDIFRRFFDSINARVRVVTKDTVGIFLEVLEVHNEVLAELLTVSPVQPDAPPPPSPQHSPQRSSPGGEGGGDGGGGGGGALLQLLAGGASPLPSPRCSSLTHSLRFNSDPDTAPSPPCSQQFILSRGRARTDGPEESPSSVSFLSKQIQSLKKKVRRYEDQFEQEMKYKPSHNDKYSNPEMVRVMNELARARKQLKELRLRQSLFESKESDGSENSATCRLSSGQQGAAETNPTLEETVESLFRRLKEKRHALGLPDNMKEMTQAQMVMEKITLQKCLLYFESVHGRPGTKQEKNLVKPLYDRYQLIKRLLCVSPTICTIEEEEGSDEDSPADERPDPPAAPPAPPAPPDSDRDSDAFVSPLDEVKAVRQQGALTTTNLHEASRSQLLQSLRETRAEKKTRRKTLREFEDEFYRQTGRICQKEDRSPMKEEYQEYKQLKAKLRLLEVLLSKQEVTTTV